MLERTRPIKEDGHRILLSLIEPVLYGENVEEGTAFTPILFRAHLETMGRDCENVWSVERDIG